MQVVRVVLLLLCAQINALRVEPIPMRRATPQTAIVGAQNAVLAAGVCAALLTTTPAPALAAPSLNEAIVEVSETSYPILKSLQANTFVPFSEKVAKLFLDIKPDKLGKAIELGVDVFLSVPPEKVDTLNGAVKDAFDGISKDSCTLVPLPSSSVAAQFGSIATEKVEPAKLKEFDEKWGPILKELPRTDVAICLPPVDKLDKLSLAQAEIGRSFGAEPSQRFAAYTTPLLKSSVSIGKVLPLVNDAKKLTPTATPKELTAFQAAGKRIELASKDEARRVQLEQMKARSAAIEASKGTSRPAAAVSSPAAAKKNVVLEEEMAAAREQAAKDAAAKKQAAIEAAQRRKEELKEAETARLAELKAKAAAIKEAKEAASAARVAGS